MNIYSVRDKVANKFISTSMCESDSLFVRTGLPSLLMDYSLNDIEFYCIGQIDTDLGIIKPCQPRLCSWDCYKFPETRLTKEKFLTIEQIDELAKAKKHEFLKKQKDTQISDMNKMIDNAKLAIQKEQKADKPNQKRIRELRKYIKDVESDLNKLKEE